MYVYRFVCMSVCVCVCICMFVYTFRSKSIIKRTNIDSMHSMLYVINSILNYTAFDLAGGYDLCDLL